MEAARFNEMLARGGNIVRQSGELCDESMRQMHVTVRLWADIVQTMRDRSGVGRNLGVPAWDQGLRDVSNLQQFFEDRADPYETAKEMIDRHGRWARHVTLERAIVMATAEDEAGEERWQAVFLAVVALQTSASNSLRYRA